MNGFDIWKTSFMGFYQGKCNQWKVSLKKVKEHERDGLVINPRSWLRQEQIVLGGSARWEHGPHLDIITIQGGFRRTLRRSDQEDRGLYVQQYTRPLNKNKILEIHIASYWFLVPPPLQCNYKPANTANYAKYGILGDYLRSLYIFHILQQGPQLGMSLSTDCADLNIVQKGDGVKPMLKKKICNGILT